MRLGMRTRLQVFAVLLLAGCGVNTAELDGLGDADEQGTDEAQLAGDAADRACNLTMRSVGRVTSATGYATRCTTNGPCYFIWEAVLDVAATAPAGSKPYVLYRSIDQTTWSKKLGTAIAGAPAGFKRYKARLETNPRTGGMTPPSMQRARLELSPSLLLPNGTRLFDHNRLAGDFEVTAL